MIFRLLGVMSLCLLFSVSLIAMEGYIRIPEKHELEGDDNQYSIVHSIKKLLHITQSTHLKFTRCIPYYTPEELQYDEDLHVLKNAPALFIRFFDEMQKYRENIDKPQIIKWTETDIEQTFSNQLASANISLELLNKKDKRHVLFYVILHIILLHPTQEYSTIISTLSHLITAETLRYITERLKTEKEFIKTVAILNQFSDKDTYTTYLQVYYEHKTPTQHTEYHANDKYSQLAQHILQLPIYYHRYIILKQHLPPEAQKTWYDLLSFNDHLAEMTLKSRQFTENNELLLQYASSTLDELEKKYDFIHTVLLKKQAIHDNYFLLTIRLSVRLALWLDIEQPLNNIHITKQNASICKEYLTALYKQNKNLSKTADKIYKQLEEQKSNFVVSRMYWNIILKRHKELEDFLKQLI